MDEESEARLCNAYREESDRLKRCILAEFRETLPDFITDRIYLAVHRNSLEYCATENLYLGKYRPNIHNAVERGKRTWRSRRRTL